MDLRSKACTDLSSASSVNRVFIQFRLHRHEEDLGLCGGDGPDHQKDRGGGQNRHHHRQGVFAIFLSKWLLCGIGARTFQTCLSLFHLCAFSDNSGRFPEGAKEVCPREEIQKIRWIYKQFFFFDLSATPNKHWIFLSCICIIVTWS